ncbi:hypothetical protein C8R44DRAFT_887707 [Mycena epipterygia]|nr:hypothetical protein C8R44DRAFT_887707 [Mycena epipterygia]
MRSTSVLIFLTIATLAKISRAAVILPRTIVDVSAAATVCACISGTITIGSTNCGSLGGMSCVIHLLDSPDNQPSIRRVVYCISVLADVVATTSLLPLQTALTLGGKAGLITSLTNKINGYGANDKKTCTHPANSAPACSRQDLCSFTCNSGYTLSGGSCVQNQAAATVAVSASADVCACISGSIEVNGNQCGSLSTSVELCTCVSLLANVVATTTLAPLKTALILGTKADLIASLTAKINGAGASDKKTCTHPAYSTPACSGQNLCGFTCNSGYTLSGGFCVQGQPAIVAVSVSADACACISGSITVNGNQCGSLSALEELCTCVSLLADVVATTTLALLKTALIFRTKADVIASLTAKVRLINSLSVSL